MIADFLLKNKVGIQAKEESSTIIANRQNEKVFNFTITVLAPGLSWTLIRPCVDDVINTFQCVWDAFFSFAFSVNSKHSLKFSYGLSLV